MTKTNTFDTVDDIIAESLEFYTDIEEHRRRVVNDYNAGDILLAVDYTIEQALENEVIIRRQVNTNLRARLAAYFRGSYTPSF